MGFRQLRRAEGRFEQYMPGWEPPARSYATRILAGDTSALVHMTDTPEVTAWAQSP
jgi:hypothetical protein